MAYMTDNEFQNLMDEVLRIVKDSESKDKTVEKLQEEPVCGCGIILTETFDYRRNTLKGHSQKNKR